MTNFSLLVCPVFNRIVVFTRVYTATMTVYCSVYNYFTNIDNSVVSFFFLFREKQFVVFLFFFTSSQVCEKVKKSEKNKINNFRFYSVLYTVAKNKKCSDLTMSYVLRSRLVNIKLLFSKIFQLFSPPLNQDFFFNFP